MSVKNTPISRSKLCTNNSKESTPISLRRQLISKTISSNKSTSGIPVPADKSGNDSVFNNAFSLPSSASKTPASTPKFRQAPTALNACYTPSSLYKSAGSTPVNHRNKITTPKTSTRKIYNNSSQKTPECFSRVTVETPRRSAKSRGDDLKTKDGEISNLSVAVRVRPLNAQECLNSSVTNIVQVDGNEVVVLVGTSADSSAGVSHSFQYDHVFWSSNSDDRNYADQAAVFNGTGLNLVDKAFEGYNACLFAYGQTGSGKSYSMMGIETDDVELNSEAGIIPRFCHELFKRIDSIKDNVQAEIEVSYFEIYNEKIHDLLSVVQIDGCLNNNGKKNALKVREHPVWGPYVVDLSLHPVDSYQSLRNWLAVGNSQRATAATGMNEKSSRSHSIFNIILNLSELDKSSLSPRKIKQTKRSKISLVDLAGSERISHTSATGDRIREGVSINKSLLTLGKVIAALADSKKGAAANFVPYRESVLTWLLRESLGGNSKTVMLATISPASIHLDETLATLRYACQARTIVNRVKVNEDPHDRVIRELRAEVERLQALRQDYERQKRHSANGPPRKIIIETSVDDSEVESLRMQLAETEKELTRAQKSWMERLQEAENLRKSEMRLLRRKGLALELSAEQKQACLVNLAADPILSGILFYILPPGTVRIGRSRPSAFPQPDIVLEGPLVAFNHCSIENTSGRLFIVPENEDFETYLNGELLNDRQQMYHGDRLVIGGSHYFRISNPNCSRKHKNIMVDYQLAHQEILQKQEEQLRRELDEEKKAALSQIELERAANERNYRERIEQLELEKFKYKCSKELLETEKKALEDRDNKETTFEYTPYKSTLLDDIQRIMQNPTEDSLHKTQLKVKEATQRCRDLGARLDFKQSQVLDEFGIFRAVVIILDKDNKRKAEWPTARLDVWLDILRENDVTKDNLFKCVDIEWESYTTNLDDTLNDSLNSSRISLNLNSVKEAILKHKPSSTFENCKNIFKNFQDNQKKDNLNKTAIINSSSKKFENTKKMLTYEDEENSPPPAAGGGGGGHSTKCKDKKEFCTSAYLYLKDMQRATLKFKKLCDNYSSNRNANDRRHSVDDFKKSIEQIEGIIYDIKATLTQQKLAESPTKTPKSVRFLLD